MYWDDSSNDEPRNRISDEVLDLVFKISCQSLPADHSYALSQHLQDLFPWFVEENAGMHIIYIPETGNGWLREIGPDAVILPSRRTRFILRLPRNRVDEVKELSGKSFDVSGHTLTLNDATQRMLSDITTIMSRHVVTHDKDEQSFMQDIIKQLSDLGIKPKKMLCGVDKQIRVKNTPVATRSIMMADISLDDSILLQQKGLGPYREYGCGIFIPQKDIQELK